jgi:protein required for attachment to host cells
MSARWILVADESRARLFLESPRGGQLQEIADFVNPEGRAMDRELASSAQGRIYSKGKNAQPHSVVGESSPVDHASDKFAKDLAEYLDHARAQNHVDRFAIVAAPRFLGKLRANIGKELDRLIEFEVDKDLSSFDTRAIAKHVSEARASRARPK